MQPAAWYAFSWRVRLTVCATGTRAAAPAEVFHALAVIPAARRSGITHAVGAEPGGRPDDRAEVARVGDRVERDDQRLARSFGGRRVEQVVGVRVLVRRHPGGQSLVDGAAGHPVELGPGHLEQREAAVGRDRERLPATGRHARSPRRRTPR